MFIYKCALCLRALIDEDVMCGPCIRALESLGPPDAKAQIDEMCAYTLEGMETRIPAKSIYALAKYATVVSKWHAALQWIRELHVKAAIEAIVRRKRGKNPPGSFEDDPNGPSDGWKEPDGDDWKGDDYVR